MTFQFNKSLGTDCFFVHVKLKFTILYDMIYSVTHVKGRANGENIVLALQEVVLSN